MTASGSTFRTTDSSSCGKCGGHGIGIYYTREKIGRECIRCGLVWVQIVSPRAAR